MEKDMSLNTKIILLGTLLKQNLHLGELGVGQKNKIPKTHKKRKKERKKSQLFGNVQIWLPVCLKLIDSFSSSCSVTKEPRNLGEV